MRGSLSLAKHASQSQYVSAVNAEQSRFVTNMAGGRPLKFDTPKELADKAAEYFASFEAGGINEGKPITITGLALALDTSRETLCNYENRDEFFDTIKRIKLRVEMFAEERLFASSATGAIFALKNFGWKDSQDVNMGGQKGNPVETKEIRQSDQEIINHYLSIKGKADVRDNPHEITT